MKRLISTCVLGLAVSCTTLEPPSPLYGRKISHLSIRKMGPNTMNEARIRACMHSQPGTELKSSQIDADIRTLYESGLVDDVRFLAKPDGLAVRLIAEVTLRHSFGPSVFVGNTLFSDQRLAKETLLKLGTTLTHEELRTACREIETFYHNNGYPNAKATVTSFKGGKPTPDDFIFRIEEGAQAGR